MARDFAQLGFLPADILLPAPQVDPARWSVVACDQYTSEPAYWQRVDEKHSAVRFCTGWATTEEQVSQLIADIEAL